MRSAPCWAGGNSTDGIFQSGNPLSVITTAHFQRGDYNADGTTATGPMRRPPVSDIRWQRSASSRASSRSPIFPIPQRGSAGTLGRNTFRGPG